MSSRPVSPAKKAFFVAFVLAALSKTGWAQFQVTESNDDTNPGSLRTAIANADLAAPPASISWSGTGGTITLGSDLPSINDQTTLNVTAATAAVTIAGPHNLYLGGGVTFNNGSVPQVWTISSNILGAGNLIKTGAGILLLTNNNYYSGGTVLNAGTLSVLSDAALGVATSSITFNGGTLQAAGGINSGRTITILGGNGTFDTNGTTSTLSGIISGTGSLTVTSSGTLLLTGANAYTNTIVSGGATLQIESDSNLGVSTGTLTFANGSTLQVEANIGTSRSITLNAGGGTFDTNGLNLSLIGAIVGVGSMTKINNGILNLSAGAANTYSGGTFVNGGTLQLGAANSLPTGGALTIASGAAFDMNGNDQTNALGAVVNNGTIYIGANRLNLSGGYSSGGGGVISAILNGVTANITNTGAALSLTGTTLVARPANPLVTNGQVLPFIAGASAGSFASIISPAAYTLSFSNATGNLTVTFVPFAKTAANSNQAAVGAAIEPARANPTGDMATVMSNLYTLDAPHLRAALDQIGPVSLAAMKGIGLEASTVQSATLDRRMNALASQPGASGFSNYTVSGKSSYPGTLIASEAEMGALAQAPTGDPVPESRWGYFTALSASAGKLLDANSSAGAQPGYAFNTQGFAGGADYRLSDNLAAGASLGYLHGHASIYAPTSGTVESQSLRYGAYATAYGELSRANLYVGGATDHYSTDRGIAFGGLSRTATSTPRGQEFNLATIASVDVRTMAWGVFSPFVGFNYDRLRIGSFTEDGAQSLNLTVSPQTAESARSSLGLRYWETFKGESYSVAPYASLGWRHEFADQSRPIVAQLASGAGTPFSVATGSYARDGTLIGLGFSMDFSKRTTAKFDYAGDFRSHFQDNSFNASLRFKF